MTTTKTKTMTAAEARRIADELTAKETDLQTRRREASRAAEAQACREQFDLADATLRPAASEALKVWQQTADDDAATLEQLWSAWCELRRANAERAAVVATANHTLTQHEPQRNEISGQPQPHRFDTHDTTTDASFVTALDVISRQRGERARDRATRATQEAILTAGAEAAATVTE